ncbi:hypothetical protein Q765_17345 [Flavobacterium rivuli WB 3.3-2 = DSM 21788]|uniref:Uncharacterized protein n=1 Tax=Flavobacterium rivuli WB 3.3-2 = DSM 21788 TaxID=1121895 RepID=A0A0A2M1D5_9FLAO|nr:hypothetical protein [Flavobacterium rivuli]KGO85258.1 hypothetical protein Q765_17345 [Flavobacterium rivuli WB 3.3-2 = DSM 21788]
MKFNPVTTAIAIALGALIAYGFYSFNDNALKVLLSLGSFLILSICLVFTIGGSYSYYSTNVNVRSTSLLFFTVAFISHFIFSFTQFSASVYIVTHGILLLLYVLVLYKLTRSI